MHLLQQVAISRIAAQRLELGFVTEFVTEAQVARGDGLVQPGECLVGLDGAFPALFLALLVPQLRSRRAVVAALVAAGIAFALIPFTPPGTPIVAASAACLLGLRRPR